MSQPDLNHSMVSSRGRARSATKLKFIDLFAGIGGIRLAFEAAGAVCVFTSEWDKYAQKTYESFHGEVPTGDINEVKAWDVPDHDILTAGFPCQPFSLAGVSKKNSLGRVHGFEDPTQGTLFFSIKEILRHKKPAAFLLENVKHLQRHDQGRTFQVICESLDEVGYDFSYAVVDSAAWVPQHRERIYIAGIRKDLGLSSRTAAAVHPDRPAHRATLSETLLDSAVVRSLHGERYTVGPGTWDTLVRHRRHHEAAGNGFGYGLLQPPFGDDAITRTLSARYYKDGAEILIDQGEGMRPRRLTPLEVCRLQGFPRWCEDFFNGARTQPVSDTQAYRQFGNSVTVPVVTAVAAGLVRALGGKV